MNTGQNPVPPLPHPGHGVSDVVQAASDMLPESADILTRARHFAAPLLASSVLGTGENELQHADGMARILEQMGGAPALQAASYLIYTASHLSKPEEIIGQNFGQEYTELVLQAMRLMQLQKHHREQGRDQVADMSSQLEAVRKMLLAFSRDLRVLLLRLASRLQTLRWFAESKRSCPHAMAYDSLHVLAPLQMAQQPDWASIR